jgi:hypothetical protein
MSFLLFREENGQNSPSTNKEQQTEELQEIKTKSKVVGCCVVS